jgi:hypothetical protein
MIPKGGMFLGSAPWIPELILDINIINVTRQFAEGAAPFNRRRKLGQ